MTPGRWLVLALVFAAAPALAQVPDLDTAERLASSNAATIFAALALMELGGIVYLFLALQKAQAKHHAETVETLTAVVTLSLKLNEGFDVLDKAVDRFTEERR